MNAVELSSRPAAHNGALEWRVLLKWLRDDEVISTDEADRTEKRFAAGNSSQHPLVRLGSAGLLRKSNGKALDTERLTEWLAGRCKIPYLRIDPLKVDVGRVTDVMSVTYAERRHALPVQYGLSDITIATCEPFDISWVAEIESHTRKTVKLVLASPGEIARYTTEFYTLSKSVRAASKTGDTNPMASFEQLVELGRST